MHDKNDFSILVDQQCSGKRLDVTISSAFADHSRAFSANLIKKGTIRVQGKIKKPGYRVKTGDLIQGRIPPPEPISFQPEPIQLDILFEDESLIVLNKQPGLVVHPAPGHHSGTLVNGLLYHCPTLEGIGGKLRPGIVHRLDKDTSGAMIVAKNDSAHQHLSQQFKSRKITKYYRALVYGELKNEKGRISLPIGRHPVDRKKMSTHSRKTRIAETLWKVKERFGGITLLELNLKTGRTHQIRVHCAAIKHPIIGDPVYFGRKARRGFTGDTDISQMISTLSRQMLHAWQIQFVHPVTEENVSFNAPLPDDMQDLIDTLREKNAYP